MKKIWLVILSMGTIFISTMHAEENAHEQLTELFSSSEKSQKIIYVDGYKIGVIFNPEGESLKLGFLTVKDGVVLISSKSLPKDVVEQVTAYIPEGYTYSILSFGSINGQSPFVALGLE